MINDKKLPSLNLADFIIEKIKSARIYQIIARMK